MSKTIVYFHPRAIKASPDRGSDLRVSKMLDALKSLGHEVIEIVGDARSRHGKIKQLKSRFRAGLKIDYVYCESSNAPIIFADKKLIPANFLVDYFFFYSLRKNGIPLGVFYRDVYWRFELFKKQLAWPFNVLLKPFYYLDWYVYDRCSDILFLPSEEMNNHLPRHRDIGSFRALPPGSDASCSPRQPYNRDHGARLKLLYVGGVEPPVYDVSELLAMTAGRDDIRLTICCRSEEWQRQRHRYEKYLSGNVVLAHVRSDALSAYYHDADIFLMMMGHSEYLDFAMPVKFFEAVGYAVPIVSFDHSEIGEYIRSEGIGWVVKDVNEMGLLLAELAHNRDLLSEKYRNLLRIRSACTWEARARYLDGQLAGETVDQ